jgi:Fe-S-cluster containining protein
MAAETGELPAGNFAAWLRETHRGLLEDRDAAVPCGDCTGCCRASQFIAVAPDEVRTLAVIPEELLFPAPGLPEGHRLLGYDEQGACPMLKQGVCSIYEDRPRTCRSYDCRVFAAARIELDEEAKRPIAERASRWKFDHPAPRDRREHAAVETAARFLEQNAERLPPQLAATTQTQRAVLSVEVGLVFVEHEQGDSPGPPSPELVDALLQAQQAFERR